MGTYDTLSDVNASKVGSTAYFKEYGTGPRTGETQQQAQDRAGAARNSAIDAYYGKSSGTTTSSSSTPATTSAAKTEKSKPAKLEGLARKKTKPDATADMGLKNKFKTRRKAKAQAAATVY
jgi:hypothetical protein